MDGFEGYGEQDYEQIDYADPEVTYVATNEDAVEYLKDPNVSDGTDFDLPQTLPQYPAEAYDQPVSTAMEEEILRLQQEYAPTQAVGVTQDILNFTNSVATGDKEIASDALQAFSKTQISRFTSPKVIGPVLLLWAWRGKLSWMERALMVVVGVGAVREGFSSSNKPATPQNPQVIHPLAQTKQYSNPLAGFRGR